MKQASCLFSFLIIIFSTSSLANIDPCDLSADTHKVYVRDFKAVGDGKTDDGPTIRAALKSVLDGPKPASLEFERGKAYRITSFEETYALRVMNAHNVTLHGNGAELSLLPPNKVLRISESRDVNLCGLTIDYSPLPFTQGLVVSINPQTGAFDIEIEDGFDVPEADSDTVLDNKDTWKFAIPYKQGGEFAGEGFESVKFEKRLNVKVVRATTGERRIRIVPEDAKQYLRMLPGSTHLAMPLPRKGHTGNFTFQIINNAHIYVKDMHIYAVPQFAFYIANNQGSVRFVNVEARPRPNTHRVMASWRDVFHVKDNRAPIQWDGCYIEGAFDDAFNLSAMYQLVVKKIGPKSWQLRDLGKDGAPIYKVGDRLQAIDNLPERKLIGEAKILSVSQHKDKTEVTLSTPLQLTAVQYHCNRDEELCGSRIVNLDAANEGSVIRNCIISGSMRIRSKMTLEHSKLHGFLQVASNPDKEGPLPKGVIIQYNDLSGSIKIGADFNAKEKWDYGERWAKEVIFSNNRITSEFKAQGASFDLINNEFIWPKEKKIELSNCGPVGIRDLAINDMRGFNKWMMHISFGQNMSKNDIITR